MDDKPKTGYIIIAEINKDIIILGRLGKFKLFGILKVKAIIILIKKNFNNIIFMNTFFNNIF